MKRLTLDIESTGLHHKTCNILGIGMYKDKDTSRYYTKTNTLPPNLSEYEHVWHHGKYDIKVLREKGLGDKFTLDHDTIVAASILGYKSKKLKDLAMEVLHVPDWKELDYDKIETYTDKERRDLCLKDCMYTSKLFEVFEKDMKAKGVYDYYIKYRMPLYRLIAEMEQEGLRLNMEKFPDVLERILRKEEEAGEELVERYKDLVKDVELDLLAKELGKYKTKKKKDWILANPPKYNPNSSKQVLQVLRSLDIIPKDSKGKATTGRKILEYYAAEHPYIADHLRYRELATNATQLKTWEKCRVGDRIYPSFNVHITDTLRLSSSKPNIQNVTKVTRDKDAVSLRPLIVPNQGYTFVIADYSQIEPRLAAHYSEDPTLIHAFNIGEDVYGRIAVDMWNLDISPNEVKEKAYEKRVISKVIMLALFYGMAANGLSFKLTVEEGMRTSLLEARAYIKEFYRAFPRVDVYKRELGLAAMRDGYVSGLFGCKLWLPKEEALHKAFNYKLQNAASDLTCFNQISIAEKLKGIAKLRVFCHDEVIYECKEKDVDKVKEVIYYNMITKWKECFKVPLDLEIGVGDSWEAKV